MNNWKDYVAVQPQETTAAGAPCPFHGNIYYLKYTTDPDGCICLSALGHPVTEEQFTLTEDEIGDAVEATLYEFPEVEIEQWDHSKLTWFTRLKCWWRGYVITSPYINREKVMVAQRTRRGVANINYENVWFYGGRTGQKKVNLIDQPIIVAEYKGKYMIFKHPKFADYGFVMKFKEENIVAD